MRDILHNILGNVNGFTIYYTIFKTAMAVRCSQYSMVIFKFDLNRQYLDILFCYFWPLHHCYWKLIYIYIKNSGYVGRKKHRCTKSNEINKKYEWLVTLSLFLTVFFHNILQNIFRIKLHTYFPLMLFIIKNVSLSPWLRWHTK